jgi:hypothetical protein
MIFLEGKDTPALLYFKIKTFTMLRFGTPAQQTGLKAGTHT